MTDLLQNMLIVVCYEGVVDIAPILFNISALYKSFTYLLTREYRQEFPVAEIMDNISY